MTVREPPRLLPDLWKWTLASGVLAVILGICVLVWPGISILVAAILFGLYLVVSGIAQVIFAFALDVSAGSRILLFISGAASLILRCWPSVISVRIRLLRCCCWPSGSASALSSAAPRPRFRRSASAACRDADG